jgi:hypothetical protein
MLSRFVRLSVGTSDEPLKRLKILTNFAFVLKQIKGLYLLEDTIKEPGNNADPTILG